MLIRTAEGRAIPRIVMHTSEPSGLGHYVSKIVLALANRGVSVVLFCPANSNDEAEVRSGGVEVVNAAPRGTGNAGLVQRLLRNVVFLAKSIKAQSGLVQPGDIVHFQGLLHLPLGFAFLFQAKLRGAKIVLTAHDPLPHRWRFVPGLRWLERRMLQFCYSLCDRIIVHNATGKDVLVEQLGQPANRISVIPHGPYPNSNEGTVAFPPFDCLRLLVFGSVRQNKGLHLAIRAFQMLPRDSGIPVRLTIAGAPQNSMEKQYWQSCKELIAASPDGIEVIDRYIDDSEVAPLLGRHHAVLLAYTEFFSESGVANLALSHERPILAPATGGLGELLNHGACGIAIVAPNAYSVARTISEARDLGPERLHKMGMEGRKFILKARSWSDIARKTAALYTELSACGRDLVPSHLAAEGD